MGSQHHRASSHQSQTSASSAASDASDRSQSTAPTVLSERPVLVHSKTVPAQFGRYVQEPLTDLVRDDPRTSVETYASTVPSMDDISDAPEYEMPLQEYTVYPSDAIASTPPEFAALFPSTRALLIHHDDATSDGNMNLRVDTEIETSEGYRRKVILFHLRMQDLKDRRFSLRRYCRDSGREVCQSKRKYVAEQAQEWKSKRPPLQRSLSSALQSLGIKSGAWASKRRESKPGSFGTMDKDYGFNVSSVHWEDSTVPPKKMLPTPTIRLEFSNYAQVEVRRQRTKTAKIYTYEYWGTEYQWERLIHRHGQSKKVSYHLFCTATLASIAHIEPEPRHRWEEIEEKHKGGWVPPCSLFITGADVIAGSDDVADVIVATGLVALIDDCIQRNWHSKRNFQLSIPKRRTAGYIAPKQLIDEVFNR